MVKQAADELGLEIGKDLKLVGWCVEELYESEHEKVFAERPVPPAMTWSGAHMVDAAFEQLEKRHDEPDRPHVRINIPTRLTFSNERTRSFDD
jgi:hypothetical protein